MALICGRHAKPKSWRWNCTGGKFIVFLVVPKAAGGAVMCIRSLVMTNIAMEEREQFRMSFHNSDVGVE